MMPRALLGSFALLFAGCVPASSPCDPTQEPDCPAAVISRAVSEANICPRDRLVVRERAETPFHRFGCARAVEDGAPGGAHAGRLFRANFWLREKCGPPPADVAGDPERLALWRRTRDLDFGIFDRRYTNVFEVSACGAHGFYACLSTSLGPPAFNRCGAVVYLGAGEPVPDR